MKIITGKYKGRVIGLPRGIRPTQGVVRKALFDILGDIEGMSFLELFSGSGAVGFEAVSRGVNDLTLVEYNRDCLLAIRKSIEALKLKACALYPGEAEAAIKAICKNKRKFDIIFMDPPYHKGMSKKFLQMIGGYDILAPNGFVVVQHFNREELPKESGNLVLIKQSRYGDTVLSFYHKHNKLGDV
ncbi:MAG: 16S rRNA (guanine(966)-N(2))-methyltransferase RsmD [Candidatus Omnitrophota bacterium]